MIGISLEGQVGIVTGAGSAYGIGRSLVLQAAKAGAKAVYACDLHLNFVTALQEEVRKINPDCTVEGCLLDVASEDSTLHLLKAILRVHGRFDFCFANAGYANYRSLDDLTAAQFDRAVAVMQKSAFYAIKYGSRAMSVTSPVKSKAKGSIVVTSSSSIFCGSFSDLAYTSVKSAITGMVINASVQLSTSNVRVNAICPGPTQSSIHTNSARAEAGTGFENHQSDMAAITKDSGGFFDKGGLTGPGPSYYYNRIAEPEEIANFGVFLASDLASAINGAVILADNGKVPAGCGAMFYGDVPPVAPLSFA